jgi:hypothetical protein
VFHLPTNRQEHIMLLHTSHTRPFFAASKKPIDKIFRISALVVESLLVEAILVAGSNVVILEILDHYRRDSLANGEISIAAMYVIAAMLILLDLSVLGRWTLRLHRRHQHLVARRSYRSESKQG